MNSLREGLWIRQKLIGRELLNKTLGIVGLGRIGGNIALRAKAFGMTLLAHDPFISPARADAFGAKLVDLDELLASADLVTLHVPLTTRTRGMIDAGRIAKMQPDAYLINCARGGLIVEDDLYAALEAGTIAGAAIDVVAVEPPPPDGSGARLHKHPKVYATPHLGGSTHEALARIATELAEDIARVLSGGPGSGVVNAPVADGPDAAPALSVPRRRLPDGQVLSAVRDQHRPADASRSRCKARSPNCRPHPVVTRLPLGPVPDHDRPACHDRQRRSASRREFGVRVETRRGSERQPVRGLADQRRAAAVRH